METRSKQTRSTAPITTRARTRGRALLAAAALAVLGAVAPLGHLPGAHAAGTVLDQQETATNGAYFDIGSTAWGQWGQTFTAGITGTMAAVVLPLSIEGPSSGVLTVQILNVDSQGLPTGAALAGGTVSPSSVYTTSFGWTNVLLQPQVHVVAGTQYAMELTSSNPWGERYLITGPTGSQVYPRGRLLGNNGYGWNLGNPADSLDFETYVYPDGLLNDTAPGITYSGSWGYSTNRGFGDYQDDEHYTTTNDDSFGYTFTGRGITVFGETNSGGGTDDVYIDGVKKATISTVSQDRLAQQALYSITGLSSGTHTIKVVKTSGGYFELDALSITQ